jgi:hypothetical protein
MTVFEHLSESRRDDARQALREVFGRQQLRNLEPLSGGVSGALILHFEVRDRPYVLRIEPERIPLKDRQRGFECMRAAAEEGVAPSVHYANPLTGVAIFDFVRGQPLSAHPGGRPGLARDLGALICSLQRVCEFPEFADYPAALGTLLESLSTSSLAPPSELSACADGLACIRTALPWGRSPLVAAHNDPNPRNILFDGTRLWLIDWELGFRNDRLVDLAILTHELADTPELETELLSAALGRAPDRPLRAQLHVIRLLTRLFYGCIVLDSLQGAQNLRTASPDIEYTPVTFRRAVADGQLRSGSPQTAYAFARMSLTAFLHGMRSPKLKEWLSLASESEQPAGF